MPDFVRFLPLSQRGPGKESAVSSDRREALAVVIEQAADLITVAGDGRAVFADAFADEAGLRPELDDVAVGDPAVRLRSVAAAVRRGGRRSIRLLASGARALLVLARDLHVDVALDPITAGSVALYASTSAPFERRAVVKGHTVRATDADWGFGHGPVLAGTATQIAAFLLGVSDDPPKPVSGRR
jgi:hypothetical protein